MFVLSPLDQCLQQLKQEDGVLVQVVETRGSVPRETGTWMVVWKKDLTGTIGGGNLEYQAIAASRALLAGRSDAPESGSIQRYPLGPSLGQCCGGVVFLRYRRIAADDAQQLQRQLQSQLSPVAVFGSGHVGIALVRLLATLPFSIRWIDSRDDAFPAWPLANVHIDYSDPMHAAVSELTPGTQVLIMSYSHWEDLAIVRECLERARAQEDLPFLGLIGSKTKWGMFRHRLQARGFTESDLARITCPIGLPGLSGKEPEVIAVAVATQLLLNVRGESSHIHDTEEKRSPPPKIGVSPRFCQCGSC